MKRRSALALASWACAARAAPWADALLRPAAPARAASRPQMLRIVRAGPRIVAVGERGIVLLSDDDGRSWRQARVPTSVTLTGVRFVDERRGFAIGHASVILATVDGGQTWQHRFDGRGLPDGLANPLLDLHIVDERRALAVGADGLALQTRDGGTTWTVRSQDWPNPKALHLYAIARQGEHLVVAGEQGLALQLAADADAATALATPYRGSWFALAALPDATLVFAGLRGTVLARSPAGEFRTLASGTSQGIVSAALLGADRLALVDQSGRVLLGDATSGRFAARPLDAERRWVAVCAARDGALVGAGSRGAGRVG